MRVLWTGLALALVLVGGATGYLVGHDSDEAPIRTSARPVPAISPSYPVNEYVVLPDPGIAPLPTDVPLRTAKFRSGDLRMTASVPVGWVRVKLDEGDSWNFTDPDNPGNTYKLRIGFVAGNRASLKVARDFRIDALEDAEANGDLEHVVVDPLTDDGFTVTYLDHGYQRVGMERFLPQAGSTSAYATVAVTGRERDRDGLSDLLERVVASATL